MCLQMHDLIEREGCYLLFSNASAQLQGAWTRGVGHAELSQYATYLLLLSLGGSSPLCVQS